MSFIGFLRCYILLIFVFLAVSGGQAMAQSAFDDPGVKSKGGVGGDLNAVSGKLDAGIISLGASAQVVQLFRNDDTKPLNTGTISMYPSSNVSATVSQNQCAQEPLEPGAVCAIAFSIKGLQAGRFRIEMLMRHDGRSKLLTTTMNGEVQASSDSASDRLSDIEAVPPDLDFGSLNASRPLVRSVILRNITSTAIDISSIAIESNAKSGFELKSDCDKLESGQACVATVTWAPESKGPSTGILVVNHTGPTGVTGVTIDGDYNPDTAASAGVFPEAVPGKGLLVSSQEEVDFGSGIATSSAITVSLVNVGDAPLILQDIRISNDENGVRVTPGGCQPGMQLDPIEACPLTLTWEPTREGAILDDIQVYHNGARGILVLPLRGDAEQAVNKDKKAIVLSSASVDSILRTIPQVSSVDVGADEPLPAPVIKRDEDEDDGEENEDDDKEEDLVQEVALPVAPPPTPVIDVTGVLEGYTITSHASTRAIVAGPGGSRVVFDGEQTVIGGVLWRVGIRPSAVQFSTEDGQKVMLLFDRSLSSFNQNDGQSGISGRTGRTGNSDN